MKTSICAVAIIEENNKFLIIKNKASGDMSSEVWRFPGGELMDGEEPEEGLIRNINEKLDMDISVLDIFKVVFEASDKEQAFKLVYLCLRDFGEPRKHECDDFIWLTLDELRSGKYDFTAADKKIINKISIFSGCGPSLYS